MLHPCLRAYDPVPSFANLPSRKLTLHMQHMLGLHAPLPRVILCFRAAARWVTSRS
jgi:hypothetical protein